MNIQESAEMYLETIHVLSQKLENVRSIDICRKMGFSKPSISRAMKNLKTEGYIDIDSNGFITLKEKGLAIADKIYERHKSLTDFFISIGVSPATAEANGSAKSPQRRRTARWQPSQPAITLTGDK